MDVLYPRCAALDVHKETVAACVRLVVDGVVNTEVRTLPTTTAGLCALAEWLVETGSPYRDLGPQHLEPRSNSALPAGSSNASPDLATPSR
jgi:hypothetical protein